MSFLRKLRKNKFVVLAICVILISLVYTGVRKAIDNYAFNKNADVVSEEESLNGSNKEKNLEGSDGEGTGGDYPKKEGQFEEGEIDLELEGDLDGEGDDGIGAADFEEEGTGNQAGVDEVADSVGSANGAGGFGSSGSNSGKIYIYITGEVNVPGVIILNEGSRIVDAINAAGGTTAKANVTKVNLVYVLEDGTKVNIPSDNDLKNNPDFEYITLNSGDGGREDYFGGASSTGSSSSNGSGSNSSNSSTSSGSRNEKKYSIVNINTATQTELETLPGIGPSLALKIINYRKDNGKFSSIEEIKNVSGIGESKFESLKRYITV